MIKKHIPDLRYGCIYIADGILVKDKISRYWSGYNFDIKIGSVWAAFFGVQHKRYNKYLSFYCGLFEQYTSRWLMQSYCQKDIEKTYIWGLMIMIMIMKFLFPCYKFRYYSRSRIYYKYNTEANEDRKMSPTLAGSHLSVLMCLHCNA